MNNASNIQKRIWLLAIVAAPALITLAHFFGEGFGLNATTGWIGVLSFTLWIIAFQGMFGLVEHRFPVYAAMGFMVSIWAAVAGTNFMVDGIYMEALGIDTVNAKNNFHSKFGFAGLMAFYLPGILFPLTLMVLGVQMRRAGAISLFTSVLFVVSAIGFPVSRIPRIPLFIHADNILLLLSHILVAVEVYRSWFRRSDAATELASAS
jgi:hypothetical protein